MKEYPTNKKYLGLGAIGLGLILALLFWFRPGIKVFLAYAALAVLGLTAVALIVSGTARVLNRRIPGLDSLTPIAQRWRVPLGLVAGMMLVCVAFAVFVTFQASQPVVSCASPVKSPSTTPPVALVTAQDFLAQGNYNYEQGDCDQAIADNTRAIALDPNLAEAYNNRAYVYMVKKDYGSALPDLDRAIQLRPTYMNALMNRGDIFNYYYAIDYARAVADYDRVLQIDPTAASHTAVCGHRLLALNHGWNLNVLGNVLSGGTTAGCPNAP